MRPQRKYCTAKERLDLSFLCWQSPDGLFMRRMLIDPVIVCMLRSVSSLTLPLATLHTPLTTIHRRCFSANGTHQHSCEDSWRMGQEPSIRKLLPLWAHPRSQIWLVVSIFCKTNFPGRMAEEAVLRSLICWAYRMWSSPAFGARSSYPRMAQALNLNPLGVLFWAGTLLVELSEGRCGWLGWDTWRKAEFLSFHDPAYSEAST